MSLYGLTFWFCSEFGWTIDRVMSLTRKQVKALVEGASEVGDIRAKAQKKAMEDAKRKAKKGKLKGVPNAPREVSVGQRTSKPTSVRKAGDPIPAKPEKQSVDAQSLYDMLSAPGVGMSPAVQKRLAEAARKRREKYEQEKKQQDKE